MLARHFLLRQVPAHCNWQLPQWQRVRVLLHLSHHLPLQKSASCTPPTLQGKRSE